MPHEKQPLGGVGQTIIGDTATRERVAGALLDLADKADAEKASVKKSLEPVIARAVAARHRGELAAAADIFDEIARTWRTCQFPGEAEQWEQRARDLRDAARHQKRRAKKGKGQR